MGSTVAARRLTDSRIRGLACGPARYEVGDPAVEGLQLRVEARRKDGRDGAKVWQLRFRWQGKRARLVLGKYPAVSQALAHQRARDARDALERGIDPRRAGIGRRRGTPAEAPASPTDAGPHSVDTLAAEFMRRFVEPHRKRPEYVRRILDGEVLSRWKGRDARTIKPRDVLDLLDGIVERGAPIYANRVAAVLSQMFRFGIHRQIIETTPVQLLFAPGGKEKPRDRALSDDELRALQANVDEIMARAPRTALAVRVLLLTAARRGELAAAEWAHVDLKGALWRIPPENAKTGVEYLTPLSPAAVAAFEALKRHAGRSRWVLPNDDGDGPTDPKLLTRSLARHTKALAKVKVAPFTLHDLRRTVRTGLARLKVAPHIAERVLNHAQPAIAATYDTHSYLDEKRAALEQWAAHLASLVVAADPAQEPARAAR